MHQSIHGLNQSPVNTLAWGPLNSWHLDFTHSLRILPFPYTISGPHLAFSSGIYSAPCQAGGMRLVLGPWGQSM